MVWTIPNTFVAGTKARANEVNDNFTSLKQFVDGLEVQASTNEINITNLENNKADLNGNNQQRFQVANPTASFDAVNLQTLQAKTLNSRSTIDGFQLSKFNNTTVTATAGNCYDSTYIYMISSNSSLQHSEADLANNATYYVYVCANSENSNVELVFDTSSSTPDMPEGFDYFRRVGKFTTDGSGHINVVTNEGQVVTNYVGFVGTKIGGGSLGTTTLSENRWLYARVTARNTAATITINGVVVAYEFTAKEWNDAHSVLIPCMAGQSVHLEGGWSEIVWLKML